jgi:hypothetical protein
MRLRSVVLPVAVALASAVVLPTSAEAAVQCGLIMPSKVVVNAPYVVTDMTLTSGCFTNEADHANWDVFHASSGFGYSNDFTSTDLAEGPHWSWRWDDYEPMGKWVTEATGAATGDGTPLTQNNSSTLVKYASKISATVTRTSTKLSWAATATQWSGRSHKNVARPGVTVGLFHQTSSSAAWTYVKSAKTSSTGKAALSGASPKAGNYRLVIAETPTVWAAYSTTIKGRI